MEELAAKEEEDENKKPKEEEQQNGKAKKDKGKEGEEVRVIWCFPSHVPDARNTASALQ